MHPLLAVINTSPTICNPCIPYYPSSMHPLLSVIHPCIPYYPSSIHASPTIRHPSMHPLLSVIHPCIPYYPSSMHPLLSVIHVSPTIRHPSMHLLLSVIHVSPTIRHPSILPACVNILFPLTAGKASGPKIRRIINSLTVLMGILQPNLAVGLCRSLLRFISHVKV